MWKSEDVLLWVEGLGEWTSPNITGLFQNQVTHSSCSSINKINVSIPKMCYHIK